MVTVEIFDLNPRWLFFVSVVMLFFSCKTYDRNSSHSDIPLSSIRIGESLSKIYCQSCHLFPQPSLLDTKSWEKGVLPQMGPRLGIFHHGFKTYPSYKEDKNLSSDFYPSTPLLTENEWQHIINYYIATSPDSLTLFKRKLPLKRQLPLFAIMQPQNAYENPATAFVKINANDPVHPLVVSDVIKQNIYFISNDLVTVDSVTKVGPVVNIDFAKNGMLICNIGLMNPNNQKLGKGSFLEASDIGKISSKKTAVLDSLERPVQITPTDLNNDGLKDYLVCEFGNLKGALTWMENKGSGKFSKHVLRAAPGAIKACIDDYNHDGLPDIYTLFSQGNEGIFLFTNAGNGSFVMKQVLQFPPSYGSTYFELCDFNSDNKMDILYTCGDNADFSIIRKPYHGIYIYINDGSDNFKQEFFFQLNGCIKAIGRDYDKDGDIDIAAIAFFADYTKQPEEGFLYLKMDGGLNFTPYTLPRLNAGRWLVMDAGDIDADGRIDIILGNFSTRPSGMPSVTDWKKGPPYLVLKNTGQLR